MKKYRELYFKGTPKDLQLLADELGNYCNGDWRREKKSGELSKYIIVKYSGKLANEAEIFIYYDESAIIEKIKINNIVPTMIGKHDLSIEEYNEILLLFYENVILKYIKQNKISVELTDDIFDPLDIMSEEALRKLKAFCFAANKSTGSSHPCDQARWYDFIIQTFEDKKQISADTLATFLADKEYWGAKNEGFFGVIGHFAWSEELALELALQYENGYAILEYYSQKRGAK